MNLTKVNRLVQRLERSRTALYLLCFVFLLLMAGGVMATTGCWWGVEHLLPPRGELW